MKIAVTYENGRIFQHFGHTEQFKIYEVEDGIVTRSAVMSTNGSGGHGALAGLLAGMDVDVLLCGGIGGGARQALDMAGIRLCGGVSGEADQAVRDFLAGKLVYNPDELCTHHGEHHGDCGGHDCGSHHCG
jgi:predicted Fe-Mo cluster-binding NifX family protein